MNHSILNGTSFKMINGSLTATTEITNKVSVVFSSLPFSIYFLGFLNYFILTSMYVLLNVPIPEQLYKFLALVYGELNKSLFSIVGMDF